MFNLALFIWLVIHTVLHIAHHVKHRLEHGTVNFEQIDDKIADDCSSTQFDRKLRRILWLKGKATFLTQTITRDFHIVNKRVNFW